MRQSPLLDVTGGKLKNQGYKISCDSPLYQMLLEENSKTRVTKFHATVPFIRCYCWRKIQKLGLQNFMRQSPLLNVTGGKFKSTFDVPFPACSNTQKIYCSTFSLESQSILFGQRFLIILLESDKKNSKMVDLTYKGIGIGGMLIILFI